jgi:hypothetical protein
MQKKLKCLSFERSANVDEIAVEVKVWSCTVSRFRLVSLMDRVIETIVSAVEEEMNFRT